MTSKQGDSNQLCALDARLLNTQAWSLRWTNHERAVELSHKVLSFNAEQKNDNPCTIGVAYRTLAWVQRWRGRFDVCLQMCDTAEAHLTSPKVQDDLITVITTRGMVSFCRGERANAHRHLSRARTLLRSDSRPDVRVNVLAFGIAMAQSTGDVDREECMIEEALALATGPCRALIEHRRVRGLLLRGARAEAVSAAVPALTTARRLNNRMILPFALEITGACYLRVGAIDSARKCFDEGLRVARIEGDARAECHILQQMALLAEQNQDNGRAIAFAGQALNLARRINYPLWVKVVLRQIADMHERAGNDKQALMALRELVDLLSPEMT